jgi:hypothetical protein
MGITYRAEISVTKWSPAGQVEEFDALMEKHGTSWVVGEEERYTLKGNMFAGVDESLTVDGANEGELKAISLAINLAKQIAEAEFGE